jgi:carboxymethylenebutenolidase
MSVQQLIVPTPDGQAPAELFTPEDGGPQSSEKAWPGVVFLTDIWGVRPANEKMARRVAEQGYAVLLPHLFYRTQPMAMDPMLHGKPRDMAMVPPLLASMPPDAMARDGVAYVDFLLGRPEVLGKKVAVVGYCFSGAMAVRTAAAAPDKVAAAASFHGGRLVTDAPDSPHTLIPRITGELYFGHAVQDQSATPEQVLVLEQALQAWSGRYESEFYDGALHGWTVEGRPDIYNPAQSERHYEKLFGLLKRNLK